MKLLSEGAEASLRTELCSKSCKSTCWYSWSILFLLENKHTGPAVELAECGPNEWPLEKTEGTACGQARLCSAGIRVTKQFLRRAATSLSSLQPEQNQQSFDKQGLEECLSEEITLTSQEASIVNKQLLPKCLSPSVFWTLPKLSPLSASFSLSLLHSCSPLRSGMPLLIPCCWRAQS